MQINIKLDEDFSKKYTELLEKHGERMAELNGFSDSQLNYSDFIDNFVDKQTVADASIDGNANVGVKDITSLTLEMNKPHSKLLAFNKIYYELKKKYGKDTADEWLESEWKGDFYLHDAATSTFVPYCFSGDTKIITMEGIKRLDELVDKKFVYVLNKNAEWEMAKVKNFGKANFRRLTLKRDGDTKEILATGNHRWFVKEGEGTSIIETDDLKPGMEIPYNTASDAWEMVKKSTAFATIHRKEATFDQPSLTEDQNCWYGWLEGYFAANGDVDDEGNCTISSIDIESLEKAKNALCILRLPVGQIKQDGNGYILTFGKKNENWTVVSVEKTDIIGDAYCAVVDGTHSFTLDNNVITGNCFAYDIEDLVNKGLYFIDRFNSQPPQHLVTYTDFVGEFVSWTSNKSSGACGLPSFLIYSYYFWRKDVNDNYYTGSPERYRDQEFQRIIYKLNQPYLRVNQSAFTNFTIYDREYLISLFGGKKYPDGSYIIDCIEELIEYQKAFMRMVSKIRETNMMTFPVLTYALLRKNGKFVDEDFARWCCKHNMKWADSNFFISEDVTSLSNCPMDGNTKILYWDGKEYHTSSIRGLYNSTQKKDNKEITVLSNGQKRKCVINKFDEPCEYRIELANGTVLWTTGNHLNKVYGKDYVKTKDLTEDDYLPYTMNAIEETKNMTYNEGYLVGMFLGDGSYLTDGNGIIFSLNRDKKQKCIDFLKEYCAEKYHAKISESPQKSQISGEMSCVNVKVRSCALAGLIKDFVKGKNALEKKLDDKVYSCSMDFRKGILQGLYDTDGGNLNRIYTSSEKLKDSLATLLATMGQVSSVTPDDRENRLGKNTCYTVRVYTPNGRTKHPGSYIIDDGYFWVKVKSVTYHKKTKGSSYCMGMTDYGEPVFMLANGIHTHNCRLVNDITNLG